MRILVVAETFLPEINGVTNSVLRVVEQLEARGHDVLIVAPGTGPSRVEAVPVERVPGVALPRYATVSVGLPGRRVGELVAGFAPDVVHLAAPVVLGAAALTAARELGIPTIAVYQTDLPGFARRYRLPMAAGPLWRWLRWIHNRAELTLAPSSVCVWDLRRHGVARVQRWARGVDAERFHPRRRCERLRRRWAPDGRPIVGYSGRLALEKGLHRLGPLARRDDLRLVLVGDGPLRPRLERELRGAVFEGFLDGDDLPRAIASFDAFVHPGVDETFCQSIQEALACGVPVVAPAAGGPLDLVTHDVNGVLWHPGDERTVVTGVEAVLGSTDVRDRLAASARPSVRHRSWSRVTDDLLDHYRRVRFDPVRPAEAA